MERQPACHHDNLCDYPGRAGAGGQPCSAGDGAGSGAEQRVGRSLADCAGDDRRAGKRGRDPGGLDDLTGLGDGWDRLFADLAGERRNGAIQLVDQLGPTARGIESGCVHGDDLRDADGERDVQFWSDGER